MTAATITAVIIAATAGAVAGYILKFVQDMRWIREICNTYEETIERINEIHRKETARFVNYINAQQQTEISKRLSKAAEDRVRARLKEELGLDFPSVTEPLPDAPEGWKDIDFGGNF